MMELGTCRASFGGVQHSFPSLISSSVRIVLLACPKLVQFYHDDLPDADNLSVELHCWQLKWDGHQGEKPSDPNQTLPHADCVFFPEYQGAFEDHLYFTSYKCEHSNSALKRLKNLLTFYNGT